MTEADGGEDAEGGAAGETDSIRSGNGVVQARVFRGRVRATN